MGVVEQAIVIGVGVEQAENEWREFVYRDEIGTGSGPAGMVEPDEADETSELVAFEAVGASSTRVTLRAEYDDEDDDVDVSSLRADVNDELARYREFVEGRNAA